MQPVKLITTTPFGNSLEITLKRWFQTKEFWAHTAGAALVITPIVFENIGLLGLSPASLLVWTVVVRLVDYGATQYLRNTSTTMIVGKDRLQDETAAVDDVHNQAGQ